MDSFEVVFHSFVSNRALPGYVKQMSSEPNKIQTESSDRDDSNVHDADADDG